MPAFALVGRATLRSGLVPTVIRMSSPREGTHPAAVPGFAGFRDDSEAPFFASRMPSFRTPEATAAEILACFSRVVFAVMREASRGPLRLGRADLVRWHRATFRSTFPYQAGRFRNDSTAFQIRWRETGELHKRPLHGPDVSRCATEVDAAFAKYNAEREARRPEQRTVAQAATAAATLYVDLLRIHPFEDGNLRAAFPALQGALISLGAAPVDFEAAVAEHDEALGWALRLDAEKRSLEPLVDLLIDRMKKASIEQRGSRMESQ
jgi:fido (protein-threonine AMPylation protein)